MEITIKTERNTIVVSIDKKHSYAILIDNLTGKTIEMTVDELVEALKLVYTV